MEQVVQIGATVVCGYLFEQVLRVMGQKELGNIVKIVALVLAGACMLAAIGSGVEWVGGKVQALHDWFEPFRNFIKK